MAKGFHSFKNNSSSGVSSMKSTSNSMQVDDIRNVEIAKISDSPLNNGLPTRDIESLASSIKEQGLLEPLAVYRMDDQTFQLISGHRRLLALKMNGAITVPCKIYPYELDIEKRFTAHLDANLLSRDKDLQFKLCELQHAFEVIEEKYKPKTKEDAILLASKLLSRNGESQGFSRTAIHKLLCLKKLTPEMLALEHTAGLSGNTLYLASSLSEEAQDKLVKRTLDAVNQDIPITRDLFEMFISEIKSGVEQIDFENPQVDSQPDDKQSVKQPVKNPITVKWQRNRNSYLKGFKKITTQEEKELALTELDDILNDITTIYDDIKNLSF